MIYTSPSYIPQLPFDPPDSVPIHEFVFSNGYRRESPIESSKPPFVCGITGKAYSTREVIDRFECLSRALAEDLMWEVNAGAELSKAVAVYSPNTIDTMTAAWATHRLNGVCSMVSAAYAESELVSHLKRIKCKALFTALPLLQTALVAAAEVGLPKERIYLLALPGQPPSQPGPSGIKTVDILIEQGRTLAPLEGLQWVKGQGAMQTAFLCASSGTSGLPKIVKISHRNVIANVLQLHVCKRTFKPETELGLGVLPMSHNFGLVAISHLAVFGGDGVVVLPTFDLVKILEAIQKFELGILFLVPAIVAAMIQAQAIVRKFRTDMVDTLFVGANALSKDAISQIKSIFPNAEVVQAYGLTETTVATNVQNPQEIMLGSCGHVLPGCEGRIVDAKGQDVAGPGVSGELLLRGPTIMLGYLDNDKATSEIFTADGWLRTGDLAEFKRSDAGHDHLFMIDRLKELIKVRGMQVSPSELETYLLRHPMVAEAAVVPVPNDLSGELPCAFIVRVRDSQSEDDATSREAIHAHMDSHFAEHKRLVGGVHFVDSLPKSGAGKLQRGLLKDRARQLDAVRAAGVLAVTHVFDYDSDDDTEDE